MRGLRTLLDHRRDWPKIILLELLFLIAFGMFAIPVRDGIGNNIIAFSDDFITAANAGQPLSTPTIPHIAFLASLLLVVGYGLYVAFQGFLWRMAQRWAGKKPIAYRRFATLSALWALLLAAIILLDFGLSYADHLARSAGESSYLTVIAWPLYVQLGWAAALSYGHGRIPRPRDFKKGLSTLLAIGILIAVLLLVNVSTLLHAGVMWVLGVVLYPPALMLVRLSSL